MKETGSRLRALRESLHLSQAKLAEALETTQSSINRYENENSEAPYYVLLWYADYFNVSLDYIFGRTENPFGKYFVYQPGAVREDMENKPEWDEFVEACFEEGSPMNVKLKEMLKGLIEEDRK